MIDLRSYLINRNVPIAPDGHHHVRKGWIGVDCPFCSPGIHHYRLGFHEYSGRVNCWMCGRVDPVEVLVEICKISKREAIDLWRSRRRGFQIDTNEKHTGRYKEPNGVGELRDAHRRYLRGRGFDPNSLTSIWEIGGMGPGKLGWRIFIPIFDANGKRVSWTTRSIGAGRRYISASPDEEAVHHKSLVYGAHLARNAIIVVEGPTDAWAFGQGAGGVLGIRYTPEQIALLAEFSVRAICFDRSADAQSRAKHLCKQLAAFPGVTEQVEIESGEDPATADPEEIMEIRKEYLEW